jgi:hypothetical protein
VSQPGGDASSFRIDGDITSAAIGGTGILIATVDNRLDPMIIAGLTPEEEEKVATTSDEDGILTIEFTDGTVRSVNLDELGIDPEDIYRTSWWFSKDGIDWALQPNESNLDPWQVVATESGFYAIDGSTVWFTTNGVSWEEIGAVKGEGRLTRSGGEAILISPERLYLLRPDGLTEYALDDLPALTVPVVGGEDGVLAIRHWNGEESELKLFSAVPGQPFELEDIPPDMESANEFGFFMPSYTVFGNRYLLLLFEDDFVPSFWIEDFPPN